MISTKPELRAAIVRLETLASIQRQRGFPIALMPKPEESAQLFIDVAQLLRRVYDPEFVREFRALQEPAA